MSYRPDRNFLRLFFATDVHGSDVTFSKFVKAADFYGADVLVLGGDMTGKMIIPLIDNGSGNYKTHLLGQDLDATTGPALKELEDKIRLLGFYSFRTTENEWKDIEADSQKYDALFEKLALDRLHRWVSLAEQKLKGKRTSIYITGGNDDPQYVIEFLKKQEFIVDPEERVIRIGDLFDMISLGYSNPTPWKTPRECSEEKLAAMIDQLVSMVSNPSKCIFNFHIPPYNSSIDAAPQVDGSVTPPRYVLKDGMLQMISAGSSAVRSAIERHQPVLALHGHIHESRGAIKIGKTVCINPGSEYSEGILRGAIVNLNEKGITGYQMTSG
jgi:Icc-related predicted phosphoesterase